MTTSSEDDLGSVVFYQPQWIAMNGGWIHSNNVLFYFAESPFFDRASANQTVIIQSQGIPEREFENLSTRKRFEEALSKQLGVQYIVQHDPLESKAKFQGPNGEEQSDVWVIKRQHHSRTDGEDVVQVTGYYYIMNQAIFKAPSVAGTLSYRLLNTTRALSDIFSSAATLPTFSVSHGHTYYNPAQKAPITTTASTIPSKEVTPMPENQLSANEKSEQSSDAKTVSGSNVRTLRDALSMTLRYGREYMDDMPLTGEPGNFRFAKLKDHTAAQLQPGSKGPPSSKLGTPVPTSRAASQPPPLQTDVPPATSKKSSAKSPGNGDHSKPRRRKSKAAVSPI